MGPPGLCKPSAYGAAGGAGVGLIVWALVAFVPAFHSGVPEPVIAVLPLALGWAGHVITAWVTPHPAAPVPVTRSPGTSSSASTTHGNTGVTGAVSGAPPS